MVAAKSRHFLALLMMKRRATAAKKALQKVAMATVHPGKDLKLISFQFNKLCRFKLGMYGPGLVWRGRRMRKMMRVQTGVSVRSFD